METKKQTLHDKALNLRIEPDRQAWERLERRLDQDRDKIKVSTIRRWLMIAASLLILVALTAISGMIRTERSHLVVVTDLEDIPAASYAYYHYASQLNAIYEQQGMLDFTENVRRRLSTPSRQDKTHPAEKNRDTLHDGSL